MLSSQKNLNFASYTRWTLSHLFSSQFLYVNTNEILRLKNLNLMIQARKNKKLHYFYLWLLTQQNPYAKKFYLAKKTVYTQPFLKIKTKRQFLEVLLKKRRFFPVLHEILWHIISKQTNAEKKVWMYEKEKVQVNIPFVPLTRSTLFLQAKNSYFPSIPFKLKFQFSCTTAFEKLFFLRTIKLLSPEAKIRALDFIF